MKNGASDEKRDRRRHGPPEPSAWVERFLPGVKAGGAILDVACGGGRHLRLALENGYTVTGIDRDLSQLDDIAAREDVGLVEADLETGSAFPLKGLEYDGVIVANYLWREILPDIVGCVASDGVFIYETFALGNERHSKPSNPDFLLRPNELIEAATPDLFVVAYEHGYSDANCNRIVQRIAACGREHPWAKDEPFVL